MDTIINNININNINNYNILKNILVDAYKQCSEGKGYIRHGKNKSFTDQPMFTIAREHGIGFLTGQAAKKLGEMHNLDTYQAKRNELLGAIVYTAAAIHLLDEMNSKVVEEEETNAQTEKEYYEKCSNVEEISEKNFSKDNSNHRPINYHPV